MYKVMLVDDEPSVISSLKRLILKKSDSFTVIAECYSADSAYKLIPSACPDVVLTDIKMPGTNWIELIKRISQDHPEIVCIVISGYDDFSYVHDAFLYGIEDYILKPVEPEKFIKLLDELKIKIDNEQVSKQNIQLIRGTEKKAEIDNANLNISEKMVNDIELYIKSHISEDNSIDTICHTFGVSQPYLSRIFRKYKNCTFNEFVISVKVEKSKELLLKRKDLLIGTIASLSGFSDQFYFSKVFKSETGFTPSEFRRWKII
jgi:two-component system response regulator YesN